MEALFRKIEIKSEGQKSELKRCLGLTDLVCFGVGKMVGAGILVLIGAAAEFAGNAVCLSYLLAAAAAFCSALCYCEATGKVPTAGGSYSIVYACLGEFPAFVVGWMILLEYACGAAALSRAWGTYLTSFLLQCGLDGPTWLNDIHVGGGIALSLLAVLYLLCLLIVVAIGITQSSIFNMMATACKLTALMFATVVAFCHADMENWEKTGGFAAKGFDGVVSGAVTVFYAYVGFDSLATIAEETTNPQVILPLALIVSIITVSVLYILSSVSVTLMVPYTSFADSAAPLAGAFRAKGIGWMVLLISFCACVGLISGTLLNLVSQARVWMGLARDGLVPSHFAAVNSWTRTPLFATCVGGMLSIGLASFLDFRTLASMLSLNCLLALTSVNWSLIHLRHHEASKPAPWILLTAYALSVCIATLTCEVGFAFLINPPLEDMSWWLGIVSAAIFILFSIIALGICALIAWQTPSSSETKKIVLPGAGLLSCLGIAVNLFMMMHTRVNMIPLLVWFVIGLVWYGGFGFRNSKLNGSSETTGLI